MRVLHGVAALRVHKPPVSWDCPVSPAHPVPMGNTIMALHRKRSGNYQTSSKSITPADILAAAEDILSRRFERLATLIKPRDAADFLRMRLAHLPHEEFHVVWLDHRTRAIAVEHVFSGTIDGCGVFPRELVRRALNHNASAAILAHNHPSGVSEPSAADLSITKEIKAAFALISVRVLDHFIVGSDAAFSFAERGLI